MNYKFSGFGSGMKRFFSLSLSLIFGALQLLMEMFLIPIDVSMTQ